MTNKAKGTKATVFQCRAADAQAVFLAGTFNGWDAGATPMVKDVEDDWTVALDLQPGRYEYKFVVDDAWCCEPGCDDRNPQCPKCVVNEYGTMNRVIEVT